LDNEHHIDFAEERQFNGVLDDIGLALLENKLASLVVGLKVVQRDMFTLHDVVGWEFYWIKNE